MANIDNGKDICEWEYEENGYLWSTKWEHGGNVHFWSTKCGKNFEFVAGKPKENGFKYCCFCGGKLQ